LDNSSTTDLILTLYRPLRLRSSWLLTIASNRMRLKSTRAHSYRRKRPDHLSRGSPPQKDKRYQRLQSRFPIKRN